MPSAFDIRSGSAKELLRQVRADRFKKTNPKLKIQSNIVNTPNPPNVTFKFADESEVSELSDPFGRLPVISSLQQVVWFA